MKRYISHKDILWENQYQETITFNKGTIFHLKENKDESVTVFSQQNVDIITFHKLRKGNLYSSIIPMDEWRDNRINELL